MSKRPPGSTLVSGRSKRQNGLAFSRLCTNGSTAEVEHFLQTCSHVPPPNALIVAIKRRHIGIIRVLARYGADLKHIENEWSILTIAAKSGNADVVQVLVNMGADVNAATPDKKTALDVAVKRGHADVVRVLLQQGARPDVKNSDDQYPLYVASSRGFNRIVEDLISAGASVNVLNGFYDRHTALYGASSNGHTSTVERLLSLGASVNVPGSRGCPLRIAIYRYHEDIVELLVTMGKAKIDKSESKDYTDIIICASEQNDATMVRSLIEAGADSGPALFSAVYDERMWSVRVLVENGADVNARDERQCTPCHKAAMKYNYILKYLVEHNANVNAQNEWGSTPLHYAVGHCLYGYGCTSRVRYLVQNHADLKIIDKKGQTPCHKAVHRGRTDILKCLVYNGKLDLSQQCWKTLVHTATKYNDTCGDAETIRYLAEHGADVNARDEANKTPLMSVSELSSYNQVRIVKELLKCGADPSLCGYYTSTISDDPIVTAIIQKCLQPWNTENHHLFPRKFNQRIIEVFITFDQLQCRWDKFVNEIWFHIASFMHGFSRS